MNSDFCEKAIFYHELHLEAQRLGIEPLDTSDIHHKLIRYYKMNSEVIERSKRLEDLAKMLEKKADAFQVLSSREKYHQWIIDLRSLIIPPPVDSDEAEKS